MMRKRSTSTKTIFSGGEGWWRTVCHNGKDEPDHGKREYMYKRYEIRAHVYICSMMFYIIMQIIQMKKRNETKRNQSKWKRIKI